MLQNNYAESIKVVLKNTKSELISNLMEQVDHSNVKSASDTIEDITTINRMMEMLVSKVVANVENKTSKTPKTRKSKAKKEETNANAFYLGDDMRGKRPAAVSCFGEKKEVSSFRDLTRAICESAFSLNPTAFMNLENVEEVNGNEHKYFAVQSPDGMDEAEPLMAKTGETCFVDIPKLSMNNMLFLRKMLKTLGIEEKNISIEIDPNYTRKPRTTKEEAES